MANRVVKVKREAVAACITCPLCNKLIRDATTISECLHTFCRKCIYDKIEAEDLECCPICNIDLGSVPLEKLRPDHILQDVRAKIFPLRKRKAKAPAEVLPPVTMPTRRKERSLSSLVVNAPKVSTQTTMTARRTRAVSRKAGALRGSSFSVVKPVKREIDSMENHQEIASSPETLNKFTKNKRQCTSSAERCRNTNKEVENDGGQQDRKLNLWKPLDCLVEVANNTKSFKSSSQGCNSKSEPTCVPNPEAQMCEIKHKDNCKTKVEDEKNNAGPSNSETVTPKKLRRVRKKSGSGFGDSRISPQGVLDAAGPKFERRIGPVWFSLVASEDQEGDAPLPQIPANFLRIKDGNIPVSYIQKYLMKKLHLTDETEVEIKFMGQPVVPTLELYNLVHWWLKRASTPLKVSASVGSSAKDFIMVLAYAQKAAPQQQ